MNQFLKRHPDATCERDEDGWRVWHDFALPPPRTGLQVTGRASTMAFPTTDEAWRSAAESLKDRK